MSTTIRVDDATKEKLERLKRDDESWTEFLSRLVDDEHPIDTDSWTAEQADQARERLTRSRESFE
jgi:predicted CopG family antitoxin